jgi:glycine hydroxymethyltransferase
MKDKQIEKLIKAEEGRQKKNISLIASENYVSDDVLKALGSKLTNKYSEGYPGHRYYGGQTFTDKIEILCQERALKLFKLNKNDWAVNVQPLSGSPANLAVYIASVPLGGKIMGMSLDHGGHLTHGHKVSATGKIWQQIAYGVDAKTEQLDYEAIKKLAIESKPNIIVAGYTAYPRTVDFKKFREIADACPNIDLNGRGEKPIFMVDMSHFAGLVAGGAYPSPFEYADVVTTTVHKTLRGPRSAMIFSRKDKTQVNAKGNTVNLSDLIDKAIFPGLQGGPHMNQIAAVAVALKEASAPAFKIYAKQVVKNAKVLASELQKLGWRIVSGGTDSHLLLVDTWNGGNPSTKLRASGITGAEASVKLEKAGIIVNKNTIPNETRSAYDPSGIRLGTAGETTRGAKERDMIKLAKRIDQALRKK